ncbi:DUF3857 domain-containing protein [Geofilum rubicundum]|uniref:DUF3857 domain-containing protein n=1 Tax=Geofilum rubicundum JCM 15548 TaxID=1236989 RepID=A0A0E9LXE7_9BACT|nr:DUF3857 domain-containing protein [Geofilum rubicundum]GAO29535.1 hypothetical protein JCM15548_11733 [Geofilum rubicundum JCM 15548]
MRTTLSFLLLMTTVVISGQKHQSGYSTVPANLEKNAHAIYRYYHKDIERVSVDKIKTTVAVAITVLNKQGESAGLFQLSYTDDTKINHVSGKIYDAQGDLVQQIKKKDYVDYSDFQDFVFYSDSRSMFYAPKINKYPYTVEYTYSTTTTGILHIDFWVPVEGYGVAVEEASLQYTTPKELTYTYMAQNHDFITHKTEPDVNTWQQKWTLKDFQALKREAYAPDFRSVFPYISLTPVEYDYKGYSGEYTTWQGYGNWVKSLIEGTTQLPAATIDRIQAMTDSLPTTRDKVKAVYQYMQHKTRYVCISVGIQGFQPMQAADVDQYGYGDCKALSNYTRSLLSAIDIPSYYAEIGADNQRIRFTDFASADQTNHAILAVPMDKDTIWLECTNPYNPFGYVGSAIANRKALLVGENGGELVDMPGYDKESNILDKQLTLKIDPNGDATADYAIHASGLLFEEYGFLTMGTEKMQKDYLLTHLPVNNLTINNFNLTNEGDEKASALLTIQFSAGQYASRAGDRLFVPLNQLSPLKIKLPPSEERAFDVQFPYPLTEISRVHLNIPENFEVEHFPEAKKIENNYFSYQYSCEVKDNRLVFTRQFSLNNKDIPKDEYTELQETLRQIKKVDNAKVILKRKA